MSDPSRFGDDTITVRRVRGGYTVTRGFQITARAEDVTICASDAEVIECITMLMLAMKEPVKS